MHFDCFYLSNMRFLKNSMKVSFHCLLVSSMKGVNLWVVKVFVHSYQGKQERKAEKKIRTGAKIEMSVMYLYNSVMTFDWIIHLKLSDSSKVVQFRSVHILAK